MTDEVHQSGQQYKRVEITDHRVGFVLVDDDGSRWSSHLILDDDRVTLIDPWRWPHAKELVTRVLDEAGERPLRDVILLSDLRGALSAIPVLEASFGPFALHCPGNVAELLRGEPSDVQMKPAAGISEAVSLSADGALRLMAATTAESREILVCIDDTAGLLYAPAGWNINAPDSAGSDVGRIRPVTMETIARRFELTAIRLTHEGLPDAGTTGADHTAPSGGEPSPFCPVTKLPSVSRFRATVEGMDPEVLEKIWLLTVGADRIESINSSYGRQAGDDVLRVIARILDFVRASRGHPTDKTMFRLDGPVLAYIFQGTLREAMEISESIRKEVGDSESFFESLSASVGMVSGNEILDTEKSGEELRRSIESVGLSRLRIARQSGGNTVCAASPTGDSGTAASGTVLLVDPEVSRLRPLIRNLERLGMSVVTATEGVEAMQVVSQIVPDVILAEVTVPKLDGFALKERLSRSSELSSIPFVLVSHRKNDALIRRAASLGILHYYRKPLSSVEVSGLVRNLVKQGGS